MTRQQMMDSAVAAFFSLPLARQEGCIRYILFSSHPSNVAHLHKLWTEQASRFGAQAGEVPKGPRSGPARLGPETSGEAGAAEAPPT